MLAAGRIEEGWVNAPPGALPTATLPKPLYTPAKPPAAKNPCEACRRVLSVSIGLRERFRQGLACEEWLGRGRNALEEQVYG